MTDDPDIDISIQDKAWTAHLDAIDMSQILHEAQNQANVSFEIQPKVSLYFTNDSEIKELNASWRQKDKATNVLSFPLLEQHDLEFQSNIPILLGELIFSYQTIEQESTEQDKSFGDHFTHLLIHGYLHLLGYRHDEDDEAELMEGLEITILAKLNIGNPYE